METFTAIFTQLGVDSSLVPQFFIILAIFIITQFLFLGKLQEVIENREEKTTKLENSADDILEKVKKMQVEYNSKIDEANRKALSTTTDAKQKINQKFTEQYKSTEKEVNAYVDQSRHNFSNELEMNKETYLADADNLAQSLVQKILQ
jgi:F0F1-type ATP synthase membrane subunit b/b'